MKNLRKILIVLLAVLAALSLSAAVLAEEPKGTDAPVGNAGDTLTTGAEPAATENPIPEGYAKVDNTKADHRYYLRTSAPVDIPAEKHADDVYITEPMSVKAMHELAASLRKQDEKLFFAGMQD